MLSCESNPSNKQKVIILGSGPNRIGQGIEFDYTCVHCAFALREVGVEAIMVNCNPETVSTDYDTSDRLYFEPLTQEDVLELIKKEMSNGELLGVNVQFGGQTPLGLAKFLQDENIPIIGTSPDMIDLAEDRDRFKQLLQKLGLNQPQNYIAYSSQQVIDQVNKIGFPIVVRPSYVLGGRGMAIVYDEDYLMKYLAEFSEVFESVDLILTPTSPIPPWKAGEKSDPLSMYLADIFTVTANIVGVPAISLPSGFIKTEGKDLPAGIQFMAPHGAEDLLFEIGKKYEGIK